MQRGKSIYSHTKRLRSHKNLHIEIIHVSCR